MRLTPLSRRHALMRGAVGLGGLGLLSACTITTQGSVTTVTLDVARFMADATVAVDVATTLLSVSPLPATVTSAAAAALALMRDGLAQFSAYAGTRLQLTLDSSSLPAALSSLIGDIASAAHGIAAATQEVASTMSATALARTLSVAADVADVATILRGIVGTATGTVAASPAEMSPQLRLEAIRMRHGLA